MTLLPKPERRGPKARRPIMRYSRPSPFRRFGNRGKWRILADDFMSLYVRHRDGWKCWTCPSTDWRVMQCSHLISKGAQPTLRYRDDNAVCQCAPCHKFFTHHTTQWRMAIVSKRGLPFVEKLERESLVYCGPQDYALQCVVYRNLLLKLEDVWKISERVAELRARGRALGVEL